MRKQLLSCVLLLVVMTFGFAACSSDGGDDVGESSGSDTETGSDEIEAFCTQAEEVAALFADAQDVETFDAIVADELTASNQTGDDLGVEFPDEADRLLECNEVVVDEIQAAQGRLGLPTVTTVAG